MYHLNRDTKNMGDYASKRTGRDFNIAFNGMLETARLMGVDVSDKNVREFIIHVAECRAEDQAQLRWLYNTFAHGFADNST